MTKLLWIAALCWGLSFQARAVDVLSINLDGYFPMGENVRWAEDRRGHRELLIPEWFHFSTEELDRGNWVRVDELKESLQFVSPEIILLQGVGAGEIASNKSCQNFYEYSKEDKNSLNVAYRLVNRLPAYKTALSCQDQVWGHTTPTTFNNQRVIKRNGSGYETVHDFETNPFPKGVFIKGLAVLYKAPWEVLETQTHEIIYNSVGDRIIIQFVKLSIPQGNGKWLLIVNADLEANTIHFEQAVQVRRAINYYINNTKDKALYGGLLISGEFNNLLYRPPSGSISPVTIPWEVAVNDFFDFRDKAPPTKLLEMLLSYNEGLKDAGKIFDPEMAQKRIGKAVEDFIKFQADSLASNLPVVLNEVVDWGIQNKKCKPISLFGGACNYPQRTDFIFVDPSKMVINNSFMAFSSHSRTNLYGMSFHPAVFIQLSFN